MTEPRSDASEQAPATPTRERTPRGEAREPTSGPDTPTANLAQLNAKTAKRQQMLLAGIGAVVLVGASWFVLGGDDSDSANRSGDAKTIDTAGLVNRNLADREFVSMFGNRVDALAREQKAMKEAALPRSEVEAELAALKTENQAMRSDGQAAIDAISSENAELKTRLAAQGTAPVAAAPPAPAYGPQADGYDARGRSAAAPPSAGVQGTLGDNPAPAEARLINFGGDKPGTAAVKSARAEAPPLVVEDSSEYLPPNSYAPARVIVGVDASAGVTSQTDPLPVVFRITGPARSVLQNGRVLTTRIEGCVVNGAARGDLSSEKVYVKLARMTCDQPGGRVAVSEVKGFISFAGKSGVRGRVVSREGSLITQALLAGIVGGFGRGFGANAESVFSGVRGTADGSRGKLSAGDIVSGGLGQGAADAADTVSKYLIERAEQYQPVVEMPTGIEVEIVFLDGVFVRNSQ